MPPPPPPPPRLPAPPELPPAESFNLQSSKSSGGSDKGALLKDIRQGVKLKKTVTNDKSGPFIAGKIPGSNNSSSNSNSNTNNKVTSSNRSPQSTSSKPIPNGGFNCEDILSVNLRPTGLRPVNSNNNSNVDGGTNKKSPPEISNKPNFNKTNSNQQSKASQIQDALRKQMTARGPPPQPPISQPPLPSPSKPIVNEDKPINRFNSNNKLNSELNQINKNTDNTDSSVGTINIANLVPNSSTLHRSSNTTVKPIASHGKPNVAPKPPGVKPSPPGRIVNRTQSMRVPRSPGTISNNQQPFTLAINGNDFNSLKNVSSLHQSHEALNKKSSATTPIKNLNLGGSQQHIGRPTQPPPSRPPQNKPPPPPPLRLPTNTTIAPPQSPPPPPPPSSTASLSRVAPPPPVSRNAPPPPPIHNRIVPPPNAEPPTPPVRHSSMRNGTQQDTSAQKELDNRYIFHPVSDFPRPDAFRGFHKEYPALTAANKQPAPLPPNIQLQLGDKLWTGSDSSTC